MIFIYIKNCSFLLTKLLIITIAAIFTVSCDRETVSPEKFSAEQVREGETLVLEGSCNFCHTPELTEDDKYFGKILFGYPSDKKLPELPNVPFGSQQWMEFVSNLDSTVWIAGNMVVFSANITPDIETGIGSWSKDDFINTIRTGMHPGWKKKVNKPMPWLDYAKLSNDELTSIYSYLMTQQPVHNKVPEPVTIYK